MYYEINVARLENKGTKNGEYVHFFATAKRSIHSRIELKKVYDVFKNVFPEPEYNMTCAYYPECGEGINLKTL